MEPLTKEQTTEISSLILEMVVSGTSAHMASKTTSPKDEFNYWAKRHNATIDKLTALGIDAPTKFGILS